MRYVDPAAVPIPQEINYSSISNELEDLLNSLERDPKGKIYRGEVNVAGRVEKKVVEALKSKYLNKCGYCESIEYEPCVEHHRPVGFVTGGAVKNKGYYWLGYEWTNMVASCDSCNERPYKGTKYPINRLGANTMPPTLANGDYDWAEFRYISNYNAAEDPQILHPEYCRNPEVHFYFNRNGEIFHNTIRGDHSIRTYGLGRKTLIVNRSEVYQYFFNSLERLVKKRFRVTNPWTSERFAEDVGDLLGQLIERANDPSKPYTLFANHMLNNVEEFFIDPFPINGIRQEIKEAFKAALLEVI